MSQHPLRFSACSVVPMLAGLLALPCSARNMNPLPLAKPAEVERHLNLAYRDLAPGEDAAKGKNKLDLYCPKGHKGFPVLFFVHGGGWRNGDKRLFGVYSSLGECLARQGIGTVVINYRLSPAVRHPEHIKDVARAFAWTCKNIEKYGGAPDQVYLCGHSAGGHLVSLLATDQSYLKAEGLRAEAIKGVIPISGVYDLTAELGLFRTAFGTEVDARKRASPVNNVTANLPPFLILFADGDFVTCDKMSEAFCRALQDNKCDAKTLEIKHRNHFTVIVNANRPEDPVAQAIVGFVAERAQRRAD